MPEGGVWSCQELLPPFLLLRSLCAIINLDAWSREVFITVVILCNRSFTQTTRCVP